ncbi:hypothetical protein K503DRAFT_859939 [Rhizopogon vinicolor AM-OR11-026]|uniref:DUF6533 domain-containing protein n=1 Tax=Rhizopogon vinicolor AM-OR11-026 TaxID=1314800 RepID=A0A1B7MKN3_9AGAM|nr:hypothetical protein K503DRAFT_859939 [Rhizopogon vinicolor AM-OR11-026]
MTIVLNDPTLWAIISYVRESSYFQAACLTAVVYDWVLTFEQEFELVWKQRWSLMTFLYLTVRYIGLLYIGVIMLPNLQHASLTDAVSILFATVAVPIQLTTQGTRCTIVYFMEGWIGVIVNVMLGGVDLSRCNLPDDPDYIRSNLEYILSGTHICNYDLQGDAIFLLDMTWVLGTAIEFPQVSGACFRTTISRMDCRGLFHNISENSCLLLCKYSTSMADGVFSGILGLARVVQMFILGPRLILGVREYHANLIAYSDEGTDMASIFFQDCVYIPTGSVPSIRVTGSTYRRLAELAACSTTIDQSTPHAELFRAASLYWAIH